MSTSSPTVQNPPIDDLFKQPSADITLRSSDKFDLHVHTQILSQASPIFSTMLSLPQPHAGGQSAGCVAADRPVIDVPEDSETLRTLLRLCYPVKKEALTELDSIVLVLNAALKYEMDWPVRLLERDLIGILPRRPLNVWAIAARCGLEELASKAASEIRARATSLDKPALEVLSTMLEEGSYGCLQGVSAGDYLRLREWLRKDPHPTSKFLQPALYIVPDAFDSAHSGRPFVPRISSPDLYVHARGSDKTMHCVHGVILACHSTVLAEQVEALRAQTAHRPAGTCSTEELRDGSSMEPHFPVLELDVDPITLHYLLDVFYNGAEHLPSSPSCLAPLIVASEKLNLTQVRTLADTAWQKATSVNPMEAYFVALQHKLDTHARAAARKVLEKPVMGWYASAMESSPATAYQHLLDYYHSCALSVNSELCKVAERCTTLGERAKTARTEVSNVPDYLREIGRRTVAEGLGSIGERNGELSLSALFKRTCVRQHYKQYWTEVSSWPHEYESYCHNLVNTMLETGSTLETSVPEAIAQVQLNVGKSA